MPSDVSEEETDLSMPGRPRSGTMDELTVEIKSEGSARKYRCAGHTKRCIKLTTQQRQFVSKCSADTSPGARAEELSKGLSTTALEEPAHDAVGFFGTAGTKQVRERNFALLDLAIVKLFAAAGLPPRLADYPEYTGCTLPFAGPANYTQINLRTPQIGSKSGGQTIQKRQFFRSSDHWDSYPWDSDVLDKVIIQIPWIP
ncbi:hypothetical protein C8F04DRAFT_1186689 [Mycena alexandri]|uniref:Uncharacterized protein n=1 Tax=Mycena alexandri TaxID=1745969 RepID=A0AAD6WZ55_9AGAR|nr:hypothetical protein C8F04DRAFT_1186689 [Mycena alexandri]